MLSAILIILIIIVLILIIKPSQHSIEDGFSFSLGIMFTTIAILVILTVDCVMITDIINQPIILNEEIAMLQEENANIEHDVDLIVQNYLDHESETYTNIVASNESTIAIAIALPELYSNELVHSQIDLHIANEQQIKDLKRKLINLETKKWLVYFG